MKTQYDKIVESLTGDDPTAVLAFYDITGNGGHAVTPYKVEESGSQAKIYVYDNNYPGNDTLYFDIDLNKKTWSYAEGKTSEGAAQSSNYKGSGSVNPFCAIPLSVTQHVALASESDEQAGMLTFNLGGEAEEIRLAIGDSNEHIVGYDFDTNTYVMDINGSSEEKRLDGMPSLYRIPVPDTFTNLATITSEAEFSQYFNELFFTHVGTLPQKSSTTSNVTLSMTAKTAQFNSALMFDNIVIDSNGSLDVAFHPGGRFLLFQNGNQNGVTPTLRMYFDDFELAQGAIHSITLGTVPANLMVGVMIESLNTVSVFTLDENNGEMTTLEQNVQYLVESQYIDQSGTRSNKTRNITQPVGSGFRLHLDTSTTRSNPIIERIF